MKVLVMGANGGTGRAAVEELRSRGHDVTALSGERKHGRLIPSEYSRAMS